MTEQNTTTGEVILEDGVSILTPATPEERLVHKSLECQVCHQPLAFLGYARRTGKDGRMAKWPVYEHCDKSLHPETQARERVMAATAISKGPARYATKRVGQPVYDDVLRMVKGRSGPAGLLYQFPGIIQPVDIQLAIAKTKDKTGEEVKQVHLHPSDLASLPSATNKEKIDLDSLGVEFVANEGLTPAWGYVFVVTRPGA